MILEMSTRIVLTLMCAMAGVFAMWLTTCLTNEEWAPWVAFFAVTIFLGAGLHGSSSLQIRRHDLDVPAEVLRKIESSLDARSDSFFQAWFRWF